MFLESNPFYGLLLKTGILVLNHTNAPHLVPLIDVILAQLDAELERKKLDEKRLCMLVSLLKLIVTIRRGTRVQGNSN